jgi:Flp pilus assembly pilin Flp
MAKLFGFSEKLRQSEDGATMLEYALLITFVALVCVVTVIALGQVLTKPFQSAVNGLS